MSRWVVLALVIVFVATRGNHARASGVPSEKQVLLFFGVPVLLVLGAAGGTVAAANLQRQHRASDAPVALGFGLGALNLGLATAYLPAIRRGGGAGIAALGGAHLLVGAACVASSIRALRLPRLEYAHLAPTAIVTGDAAVPALAISGRW
jgi:hypothetical protein